MSKGNIGVQNEMYPFGIEAVLDLYDDLDETACAMKTLAELLATADYGLFSAKSTAGSNCRYGLKQLLLGCVDRQETRLNQARSRAINSPEFFIESAKKVLNELNNGLISAPRKSDIVKKTIANLNTVISDFNENEYPEVIYLRECLIEKLDGTKTKRIEKIKELFAQAEEI